MILLVNREPLGVNGLIDTHVPLKAIKFTLFSIFQGKDLEQTHEFQKFLDLLKQKKDGDAVEVTDLINGQLGALGLIISSKTLLDVGQNSIAKLPHFQGAFLAIGKAGEHCKVSLIETNFLNTV